MMLPTGLQLAATSGETPPAQETIYQVSGVIQVEVQSQAVQITVGQVSSNPQ